MTPDFIDMLSAFCDGDVEFLLVGAHAMATHGHPRATGDLGLWVHRSEENAGRVHRALARFGAPVGGLTVEDLQAPDVVIQIGVAPCRIDILTSIDGVQFDGAWKRRVVVPLDGVDVPVLGREDLIANKRATGRPQDLVDVATLEAEGD